MRILLLNDNPVARKLVALSAQYTENELTIIGSVSEIEQSDYDVVIVDDAYYSGETMAALAQKATYTVSILMAARGNNLSKGFDKVLNKPFLPADLIALLTTIQETLPTPPEPVLQEVPLSIPSDSLPPLKEVTSFSDPEPSLAHFDDPLPPLKEISSFGDPQPSVATFDDHPLPPLKEVASFSDPLPPLKEEADSSFGFAPSQGEEEESFMSFEEFSIPQEADIRPSILDRDVVQDVQNLLKTTDTEEVEFSIGSFDFPEAAVEEEIKPLPLLLGDEGYAPFEEMSLPEPAPEKSFFDAPLLNDGDNAFGAVSDDYLPLLEEKRDILEDNGDERMYDAFIPSDTTAPSTPAKVFSHPYEEEMKIDFYSEDVSVLPVNAHTDEQKMRFYSDEVDKDLFDGIPEREMKLAMGEPVEEATYDIPVVMTQSNGNISSEGMEALQVLLKALSNEETVSSLKGLNISININLNLGNGK